MQSGGKEGVAGNRVFDLSGLQEERVRIEKGGFSVSRLLILDTWEILPWDGDGHGRYCRSVPRLEAQWS